MSIQVICECGKSYKLKDETAGKKVRCPNCQAVIRVPADMGSAADTSANMPDPLPSQEPAKASRPESGIQCPSCQAPLDENAVICVQCGLDLRTGKKLTTDMDE